jgi:hypothetical protein
MSVFAGLAYYPAAVAAAAAAFAVSATFAHRSASEVPDAQGFSATSAARLHSGHPDPPLLAGRDRVEHSRAGLARLRPDRRRAGRGAAADGVRGVVRAALQRRLRQERIPRNELLWALTLVVGLAGFLLVATAGVSAHTTEVAA